MDTGTKHTQQNYYSIRHLHSTMTTWCLDIDRVVTVLQLTVVTTPRDYTDTVQSLVRMYIKTSNCQAIANLAKGEAIT